MEAPALNLDFITPELAIGGSYDVAACAHLSKLLGIRRIVDLRVEACDDAAILRAHGIELLHLPTIDRCAVSQALLDRGVEWVTAQLRARHKVYLHFEHGIGRSALLALCVLAHLGAEPLESLRIAKRGRWKVSPSPEQLEGFVAWCRRHGHGPIPTFDELAYVAYAHLREGATSAPIR